MTIKVIEEKDGSLTISWDENDPEESIFNTWSSEDFIKVISDHLDNLKSE